MIDRSSNFSYAQELSIRVEKWIQQEKITFTPAEKIKLERALAVLNKAQAQTPFIRAISILELYENAERGINAQRTIESLQTRLDSALQDHAKLSNKHLETLAELSTYKKRSVWTRIKAVFRA